MTAAIKYAHRAITGGRDYQEDHCQFDENGDEILAVLADGMGGQGSAGSGARASETACNSFIASYRHVQGDTAQRLQGALDASNDTIALTKEQEPDLGDMGTTLIGASVRDGGLQWVSVGDSLLYLYRDGKVERLNEDHSLAPMLDKLAEEGQMTREEALSHRNRNAVRSAVMGTEIELTDLQRKAMPLKSGDVVVLASDGLDTLDQESVAQVIGASIEAGPERVANALLDAVEAKRKPDQDNTMVMVLAVEGTAARRSSSQLIGVLAAAVLLLAAAAAGSAWFLKLGPFAAAVGQKKTVMPPNDAAKSPAKRPAQQPQPASKKPVQQPGQPPQEGQEPGPAPAQPPAAAPPALQRQVEPQAAPPGERLQGGAPADRPTADPYLQRQQPQRQYQYYPSNRHPRINANPPQ